MTSDELKLRTKKFAHDCIHVAQELPNNYLGNHVKGQLIRCSTSVGANYRAACLSQSKAGFIAKLSISIEEADETAFWLEFSYDEQLLNKGAITGVLVEAKELTAIFVSARKTAQANLR